MTKTKLGLTHRQEISVNTDDEKTILIKVNNIEKKSYKQDGKKMIGIWVEDELFDQFSKVCDDLSISKTKWVKNKIKKFVKENI